MRKLQFILAIPVLLLAAQACDNREDFFSELNRAPELKLFYNNLPVDETFADSIKLGFPYRMNFAVADELTPTLPALKEGSSDAISFEVDELKREITLSASREGMGKAIFYTVDPYGAEASKEVVFTFFSNLKPVARFYAELIGVREVQLNASPSYDKDSRFGGNVTLYEFSLDGYKFQTYSKLVRYKFPSNGSKVLQLRVKDNNEEWSDTYTVNFPI